MSTRLSCGGGLCQCILLLLNILFLLLGLGIMGVGIYIKVDKNMKEIFDFIGKAEELSSGTLSYLAVILIGGGVVTVLIALFGCAGALWRSRCSLYVYAFILFILLVIEFVAAILAAVYKNKLEDTYKETLFKIFDKAFTDDTQDFITAYYDLENTLDCCGVYNVTDYDKYPNAGKSAYCREQIHQNAPGCSDKIIDIFSKNLPIVGGVLGGIVGLELFTLIGACCLARAIANGDDDDDDYIPPPKKLSSVRRR